jgi:hypothetical protein
MNDFNVKKLNNIQVKQQHQVKVFSKLTVLETAEEIQDNSEVDFNKPQRIYRSDRQ